MAVPNFQKFMKPILEVFNNVDRTKVSDIVDSVAQKMNLSEEQRQETLTGGRSVLKNRIDWAVQYLFQASLLSRISRGVYSITKTGKELLASGEEINNRTLERYDSFRAFRNNTGLVIDSNEQSIEDEEDPETQARMTIHRLNEIEKTKLLEKLKQMPAKKFECFIKDFMVALHYGEGVVTRYTNDGGIDAIIYQDELRLNKIYLQAKRFTNTTVGSPEVQAFSGAMDTNAKYGVFITTSEFTRAAIDYVRQIASNKVIVLVSGKEMVDKMFKYNFGVKPRQTFEVKEIDNSFLDSYFEE